MKLLLKKEYFIGKTLKKIFFKVPRTATLHIKIDHKIYKIDPRHNMTIIAITGHTCDMDILRALNSYTISYISKIFLSNHIYSYDNLDFYPIFNYKSLRGEDVLINWQCTNGTIFIDDDFYYFSKPIHQIKLI